MLFAVGAIGQLTYIYNVVAYAGHKFHTLVGLNMNLLNKILPQVVLHYYSTKRRQIAYGITATDGTRGDDKITRIVGAWHYAVVVVYIVVVAIVCLDAYYWHSLRHRDVD